MLKNYKVGYTYDDVLLVPQYSTVKSRKEIDISTTLFYEPFEIKIKNPIIPANMDTISELEMIKFMYSCGGVGILHRYMHPNRTGELINEFIEHIEDDFSEKKIITVGFSVGINDWKERCKSIKYNEKYFIPFVVIDIAHGDSEHMLETIKLIRKEYPIFPIMAGNIATAEGAKRLKEAGANCIKCGIGGGCIVPDSLINTSKGKKQIQNIKIGDEVLTHTGNMQKVSNIIRYNTKEKLVKINNIKCTKEHKLYVINKKYKKIINEKNIHKYAKWISAGEITKDYMLVKIK